MNKKVVISTVKNISLSFFAVLFVFIAGELAINVTDFLKQAKNEIPRTSEKIGYGLATRPDPFLNHVLIPNAKFVYVDSYGDEFKNPVEFNSKGLNDYEYEYEKPDNMVRIVILGDSFVEAREVERKKNFCELMEKTLKARNLSKRYQVINMGVGGYSPILEYLYLKKEGIKYDPDIIILCFFMNDVYEDMAYKSMAKLGNDGLPISVHWRGFDKTDKLRGWKRFERGFCNAAKNIANRSKFYVFLKSRIYRLLTKIKLKEIDPKENRFFILTEERRRGESLLWEDTFRYILAIKNIADSIKVRFFLVSIPIEAQLTGGFESAASKYYFKEKPTSERAERNIASFCNMYDIDYVSLYEEFKKRKAKNLYFKYDGHLNDIGHRETAESILEKLESLGWVEKRVFMK